MEGSFHLCKQTVLSWTDGCISISGHAKCRDFSSQRHCLLPYRHLLREVPGTFTPSAEYTLGRPGNWLWCPNCATMMPLHPTDQKNLRNAMLNDLSHVWTCVNQRLCTRGLFGRVWGSGSLVLIAYLFDRILEHLGDRQPRSNGVFQNADAFMGHIEPRHRFNQGNGNAWR